MKVAVTLVVYVEEGKPLRNLSAAIRNLDLDFQILRIEEYPIEDN